MPIWFLVQLRWGCGLFMFQAFFFFQRKLHVLETVMWLQTFSFSLIWFKIAYKNPVYKVLNSELPHYISLPMILLSINLITNSTKFKISGQLCVYNLLPGKLMKSVLLILKDGIYLLNYKWFSVVTACWFPVYFILHVSISHF